MRPPVCLIGATATEALGLAKKKQPPGAVVHREEAVAARAVERYSIDREHTGKGPATYRGCTSCGYRGPASTYGETRTCPECSAPLLLDSSPGA